MVDIRDVRAEQSARYDWAAASAWRDAGELWDHLRDGTNIVRAAELVDWAALLPERAEVLDLGCGGGWLTARLSREPRVQRVLAWDGSPSLLSDVLPEMVELAGGDSGKVERVCGDFLPVVLDDDSLDLLVMSSAFHHADRPRALLAEIHRVLRPDATAVLLNETPWHPLAIVGFATRTYVASLVGLVGHVPRRPGHLGSHHVLYDAALGDRAYGMREWRRMLTAGGFELDVRATGLSSYPADRRPRGRLEPELVHFVLRALPGGTRN